MRIRDWSSDVCSSDLVRVGRQHPVGRRRGGPTMIASPFRALPGGVRVAVRVTPKASADRVRGVVLDEAGIGVLQVAVTAAPEDGRANKAVTALLAKRWRVPNTTVEVVQGATDTPNELLVRGRSEERRVGKEFVCTCIFRGFPHH